jgi:AcrR family transcriptional regulator
MARKTTYSRDDVLDAAVGIVDEHGLPGLTARRVADRLGSSTAPVYSNFTSMDELHRELIRCAADLLLAYTAKQYTENVFLNMGVGVTSFARDHAHLYRMLFLDQLHDYDPTNDVFAVLLERMGEDEELARLPLAVREDLLDMVATYTHGLATLVCTGRADEYNQEEITSALRDVGGILVEAARRATATGMPLLSQRPGDRLYPERAGTSAAEEDHES